VFSRLSIKSSSAVVFRALTRRIKVSKLMLLIPPSM
jgi:hypothetical protein